MWDPDGDPDGKSPIEPETSGNSRTYIDPTTYKIITRQYVDEQGQVYERDDNFDQGGNPQLKRVYDHITGKLQHRETIDPKTGIITKEDFDKDGKPTNVGTFKDNQQLTNETYENGKLVKRTTYWPGTDKFKKVEEDFDGDKPKKTTDYPLSTEPSNPPLKTATEAPPTTTTTDKPPVDVQPPRQPDTVVVFEKTSFTGTSSGSAEAGSTVALFTEKPPVRKSAEDNDFNKGPTRCATGADRRCKMEVSHDDREAFGLPSASATPSHYSFDVDTPQHSGWVAETTGKTIKPAELASALPPGDTLTIEEFKRGKSTITRIGIDHPVNENKDLMALFSKIPGVKVEIDTCKRTKPALGPEPTLFTAISNALPATMIKLHRAVAAGRGR